MMIVIYSNDTNDEYANDMNSNNDNNTNNNDNDNNEGAPALVGDPLPRLLLRDLVRGPDTVY